MVYFDPRAALTRPLRVSPERAGWVCEAPEPTRVRPLTDDLGPSVRPVTKVELPLPPEMSAALSAEVNNRFFTPGVDRPNLFVGMPQSRALLEKALASVLRRQVGAAVDVPTSQFKYGYQPTRIYSRVEEQLNRYYHDVLGAPPEEEVRVLAGGVRTALGYLYEQMYDAASRPPYPRPEDTLLHIAYSEEDLSGLVDRGAAADWDMYLLGGERFGNKLVKEAKRICNETGDAWKWREHSEHDRAQYFAIPDVHMYRDALRVTTMRGGSSLDWLAFDLKRGKLVEPEAGFRPEPLNIVEDLLAGVIDYLPPTHPEKLTMPGKQAVRGLRPLLEIPYLRYRDDRVLVEDLRGLLAGLQAGTVSPEELRSLFQQTRKLVTNQRAGAAGHRAFRGAPGSPESFIPALDAALMPHYAAAQLGFAGTLVPESLRRLPDLVPGGPPALRGLVPPERLSALSDQGRVYFSTPYEHSLNVLRNGLFHTSNQAEAPRGARVFSDRGDALRALVGETAVVVEQRLRQEPPLRILDWEEAQQDPWVQQLLEETPGHALGPVFDRLGQEGNVDGIVYRGELYLQRANATERQDAVEELARAYGSLLENIARLDDDAHTPIPLGSNPHALAAAEQISQRRHEIHRTYVRLCVFLLYRNEGRHDLFNPQFFDLRLEASELRLRARAWHATPEAERVGHLSPHDALLQFIRITGARWFSRMLSQSGDAGRKTVRNAELAELSQELEVLPDELPEEYTVRRAGVQRRWFARGGDLSGFGLKELTRVGELPPGEMLDLFLRCRDRDVAEVLFWPVIVERALEEPAFAQGLASLETRSDPAGELAELVMRQVRGNASRDEVLANTAGRTDNAVVRYLNSLDLEELLNEANRRSMDPTAAPQKPDRWIFGLLP